jgi:hypothetical protein
VLGCYFFWATASCHKVPHQQGNPVAVAGPAAAAAAAAAAAVHCVLLPSQCDGYGSAMSDKGARHTGFSCLGETRAEARNVQAKKQVVALPSEGKAGKQTASA